MQEYPEKNFSNVELQSIMEEIEDLEKEFAEEGKKVSDDSNREKAHEREVEFDLMCSIGGEKIRIKALNNEGLFVSLDTLDLKITREGGKIKMLDGVTLGFPLKKRR